MLRLETEELVGAVDTAHYAVSRRQFDPTLQQFKLAFANGWLGIWATDLTTAITSYCRAEGDFPIVTVEAKMLRALVKQMRADEVKLGMNQFREVAVECGAMSATLPTADPEKFPKILRPEGWIDTGIERFKQSLRQVEFAIEPDIAEQMLAGMCFKTVDGALELAATDKVHMAVKRIPVENSFPIEEAIVPHESIKKLMRIAKGSLYVGMAGNTLAFKTGNTILNTQLVDKRYPPYQRFWRDSWATRIVVPVDELKHAVRTANVMTRFYNNIVEVRVSGHRMLIYGRTMERGSSQVSIEVQKEGDDIRFLINGQHLENIAKACDTPSVAIELESEVNPIFFKPIGDDSHWMMSMPMADEKTNR